MARSQSKSPPPRTTGSRVIADVRRANLQLLAERIGMGTLSTLTGKSRQQLHQYIGPNPVRNIGEQVAREVEQALAPVITLRAGCLDASDATAEIERAMNDSPVLKMDAVRSRIALAAELEGIRRELAELRAGQDEQTKQLLGLLKVLAPK